MHSECQHQSIHRISIEGKRPEDTEWYECKNKKCGIKMLVKTVAEIARSIEQKDAEHQGVRLITKAVSEDGAVWDSVSQAKKRNQLLKEVAEVESFLRPRTPQLENGDGYIQQDERAVDEFLIRFMKLVGETLSKDVDVTTLDLALVYVEEGHPLHKLNERRKCVDQQYREWQSPYLASHPGEAKPVNLSSTQSNSKKESPHHEQRESG